MCSQLTLGDYRKMGDYPRNLVSAIFGLSVVVEPEHLVVDYSFVDSAVDRLRAVEMESIRLYFRDQKTLRSCGESLGLSEERVRHVLVRALRRLRGPSLKAIYTVPKREEWDSLRSRLSDLEAENCELRSKLSRFDSLVQAADISSSEWDLVDIYELEFSVRAVNALRRGGVNSVGDLLRLPLGRLRKLRNLGVHTIKEICSSVFEKTGYSIGVQNSDVFRKDGRPYV